MWRQVSQAADKQGDIDNIVRALVLLKIEEELDCILENYVFLVTLLTILDRGSVKSLGLVTPNHPHIMSTRQICL